jgi:hypothetical protein
MARCFSKNSKADVYKNAGGVVGTRSVLFVFMSFESVTNETLLATTPMAMHLPERAVLCSFGDRCSQHCYMQHSST